MKRLAMNALALGLRVYMRAVPFRRGRGVFVRLLESLKARGWPAPVTAIAPGVVMELEPSLLGLAVFEHGRWEPEQTGVFTSLIARGEAVVIVGANTGYYALLAASLTGPDGRVYAFEIQPSMIAILRRNIERNAMGGIVTVIEAGCFSSAGEAVIEPHGDPGSARIAFGSEGLRVPLVTLDGTLGPDRIGLILIDAEGADFEILKGARAILERDHPNVIAEVHHLAVFGGSEEELRRYMASFGYEASELRGEFSRDLLFRASREKTGVEVAALPGNARPGVLPRGR